uniref:Nucleoprotein n=1 Tax=Rice stripe mosaic virus TaxID=1931356 RepID=A0A3G6VA06_9RHAB|nr:nucleocapsid protein [Rice stripe mosaic virus]
MATDKSFEEKLSLVPENTKLYSISPEAYSDDKFDKANCYKLEKRSEYELTRLYKGLVRDLGNSSPSTYAVERLLVLASHLYETKKGSSNFFLTDYLPKTTSTANLDAGFLAKLKETPKASDPDVSDVTEVKTAKATLDSATTDADTKKAAYEAIGDEDSKKAEKATANTAWIAAQEAQKKAQSAYDKAVSNAKKASRKTTSGRSLFGDAGETVTDESKVVEEVGEGKKKFGPFLAAYLMRLLTKIASNVTESWEHMKGMYKNFYGYDAPSDLNCPEAGFLEQLKSELNKDRRTATSWVKIVAEADNKLDQSTAEAGILRYVAVLPLAYSGMHAMKLFMDVKMLTKLTSNYLIGAMRSPLTKDALDAIMDILISFESTTKTKKSEKFRFARIVSTQFFQSLQTKNCKELVYLMVQIIAEYRKAEGVRDPMNIAGLDDISSRNKKKLNKAVRIILAEAPKASAGEYSSAMKKAFLDDEEDDTAKTRSIFQTKA